MTSIRHVLNLGTVGAVGLLAFLPSVKSERKNGRQPQRATHGRQTRGRRRFGIPELVACASLFAGLLIQREETILEHGTSFFSTGLSMPAAELREAVQKLAERKEDPRVFATMGLGGGLTWFSSGKIKNFIDGRLTSKDLLEEYLSIYYGTDSERRAGLSKYKIDTILLSKAMADEVARHKNLIHRELLREEWWNEWEALYSGDTIVVMTRRDSTVASAAAR
jgi:hypothetical protein